MSNELLFWFEKKLLFLALKMLSKQESWSIRWQEKRVRLKAILELISHPSVLHVVTNSMCN